MRGMSLRRYRELADLLSIDLIDNELLLTEVEGGDSDAAVLRQVIAEHAPQVVREGFAPNIRDAKKLIRWMLRDVKVIVSRHKPIPRRPTAKEQIPVKARRMVADLTLVGLDPAPVIAAYKAGRDWEAVGRRLMVSGKKR